MKAGRNALTPAKISPSLRRASGTNQQLKDVRNEGRPGYVYEKTGEWDKMYTR
jgi:hypothetical protein